MTHYQGEISPWTLRLTPRQWQITALQKWNAEQKGVVSVVTGGGKTVFAQLCIQEFRKSHPTTRVLIVVPTLTLLDQWYVSLREDLAVPVGSIKTFSGEEYSDDVGEINITVVNTARKIHHLFADSTPTLLIVDECHRAGSPRNSEVLSAHHTATLGLSATPVREYDDGFKRYVEPGLGPIIYEYDYTQAYDDNVICPFDLINLHVKLLPDEEHEYNKLTRSVVGLRKRIDTGEANVSQLKNALIRRASISANATTRISAAAKIADSRPGRRTLVFHESIDSAEKIRSILESRGHRVTAYHSRISAPVRRDNLLLYRRGLFDVLVSCRSLDEGMNVPETEIAIIASATSSSRQRIQRLGRVLRPAPGKNRAIVYTIYATEAERIRLEKEADSLQDISNTRWLKMNASRYGKDTH